MLAQGKVRFVGDMVAFVVADTLELARAAAEAVVIDYEVLPSVVGVLEAVRRRAATVRRRAQQSCCDWELGDKAAVATAFKKRACGASQLVNNRLIGNPMEPRAAIAEYNGGTGHHTLWTTSQFPHVVRFLMSALVLKIPEQKMRVVRPTSARLRRQAIPLREEAVITWAAKRVAVPSNGWRTARRVLSPTGTAGTTSPRPNWRWTRMEISRAEGRHTGQHGWLSLHLRPQTSRPISMDHC